MFAVKKIGTQYGPVWLVLDTRTGAERARWTIEWGAHGFAAWLNGKGA